MIGFWKRLRIPMQDVRAASAARREVLKSERTKTDEIDSAVSRLLDELALRGRKNET